MKYRAWAKNRPSLFFIKKTLAIIKHLFYNQVISERKCSLKKEKGL